MDDAIGELERVAALHWRAAEEERLGGWLLRAAGGFTSRANSALAAGDPGVPLDDALAAVGDWYRVRGLRPMIAVPMPLSGPGSAPRALDDYLSGRAWPTRPAPSYVMTADLPGQAGAPDLPPGTELRMDAEPDDAWLGMHARHHGLSAGHAPGGTGGRPPGVEQHYRGQELPPVARELLMSAAWQRFASIRDSNGTPVAIARVSVAGDWAGITAVEVSAAHRRQGLGTLITRAACAEAARQGVERVFLQVETANVAALALYERSGFRYSHRYHYRIAPPQ